MMTQCNKIKSHPTFYPFEWFAKVNATESLQRVVQAGADGDVLNDWKGEEPIPPLP